MTLAMKRLRRASAEALALPAACAGCGAADRPLCGLCRRLLSPLSATVVARVAGAGFPVFAGAEYDGVVRRVIRAYKDEERVVLARALAPLLAVSFQAVRREGIADGSLLLVVPSTRRALRARGFDHVAMLARRAGLRPRAHVLRSSARRDQASLGRAARFDNLRGSVRCVRVLHGVDVVLVDDVVTTGATLGECARAVHEAGGRVVAACVCARTPMRGRAA